VVLTLQYSSTPTQDAHIHFGNVVETASPDTHRQFDLCLQAASRLVHAHTGTAPESREYQFFFPEGATSFAGTSMGLAVSVALTVDLQRSRAGSRRWHLHPRIACTGNIDAEGRLETLPAPVVRHKAEAAFFSPMDSLVLPAPHAEESRHVIGSLQRRYPQRQMRVFGVRTLADCLATEEIIRVEERSFLSRLRGRLFRSSDETQPPTASPSLP
jgi:hypothetical protein